MERTTARPKLRRDLLLAAYLAATLAVLGVLFFVNPTRTVIFVCPFRQVTGLDCPGCGMTRAVYFLLRLNFAQAFRYHPFVFVVVPMLFVAWLQLLLLIVRGRGLPLHRRAVLGTVITVATLMVLFDIGRNIPGWALSGFKV